MEEIEPDETTDNPTVEPDETPEATEAAELQLTDIQSLDDVKNLLSDGFNKLRDSSADEIKAGALKVGNRFFKAFRKLVDGD